MFTVDDKYFRQIGRIYSYLFKCNYRKIQRFTFTAFIAFLESTVNFEHFQKTMGLIVQVFLKLLTLKNVIT